MKPETNQRKSLWGYGIAAVYTFFAVGTLGVVAFTMTQKVELVSKDYYAKEVKYDQQINRQRQTSELAEPMSCGVSADGQSIRLQFPASAVTGAILLYRPSSSALDQEFAIAPEKDGTQALPTAKLARGVWRVKVTWSLAGREFYNEFVVSV
ncbi:MAG: FixH family protein [Blastocatellia bacterium]